MAELVKAKDLANVFKTLPEDKLDDAASKLGLDADAVKDFISNPAAKGQKAVAKNILEKIGNTLSGAQEFVDQVLGRVPKPSPEVPSKFKVQPTGPGTPGEIGEPGTAYTVKTGAPETALVPVTPTIKQTGAKPPEVPASARTEMTGPEVPGAVGSSGTAYTTKGTTPDRAIVPSEKPAEAIEPEVIEPGGSLARVQRRVQEAQPIEPVKQLPPPGRREETLRESLQEGQPGMEQLPEYPIGLAPSPESWRKAGKAAAAAGGLTMAGLTGMKLFGDRPLSQQDYVGDTTRVAEVTATPDIKAMTDKAMPHVPEQAKEIIQNQVQKVLSLEERLDKELSSARARYDKEVARKEMLQAIETVMHGLVTALGAKAALDRGSPFAIDFSKGPQVNWESKFANLQKDFELQTNAIVKKYDLEQKERLEQQKAEESKRRYEERMALEREKLGVERTKAEQQITKQQAEDVAKLNAADQKQYQSNVKNFALLKEAIQNKKAGDVVQYATLLGADDKTIDELNKGKFDRILSWVKGEKSVDDILQGLRPQRPAPAAAPVDNMVTVTVNGQTGRIPRDQLEAFKKQYPNAEVQ